MLAVISPAKSLDFSPAPSRVPHTQPTMLDDAQALIDVMSKKSVKAVGELMGISEKLARLNYDRYRDWHPPFTPENAKQAVLAFQGDVYQGIETDEYRKADFEFAQKHVRILSGLYGVLRPLDLIQAYRLEMGTRLKTRRGADLYGFWGDRITEELAGSFPARGPRVLVNLASNEYFGAVRPDALDARVVTPVFKDLKNGKYRVVSFFAKRARGLMVNYLVTNRIKRVDDLRQFDVAGYAFNTELSDDDTWTFTRDAPPA